MRLENYRMSESQELHELRNTRASLEEELRSLREEQKNLENKAKLLDSKIAVEELKKSVETTRETVSNLRFKVAELEQKLKETSEKSTSNVAPGENRLEATEMVNPEVSTFPQQESNNVPEEKHRVFF